MRTQSPVIPVPRKIHSTGNANRNPVVLVFGEYKKVNHLKASEAEANIYIILSHNETFMYALTSAKVGKKKDALQSMGFIRKWLRNFPQRRGDNGLILCFAPAKMLYSAQICLLLGTETAMYSGSDLWILTVRAKMNIRSNSSSKKNKKWRDR